MTNKNNFLVKGGVLPAFFTTRMDRLTVFDV